ncbi:hypothetical protein ACWHA1_38675 [Streptomyces decoyicus]
MSDHRTVLAEGRHDDLIALLDGDTPVSQWRMLSTLPPRLPHSAPTPPPPSSPPPPRAADAATVAGWAARSPADG